jgi:tRNA1(Val) A37 N6-methylase TrmN6
LSQSLEKSIAKHELKCDIFGIMRKTGELLKKEGRAYFIYSARRKEDFMAAAEQNGFKVKRLRSVLPRSGSVANFMLAECRFSSPEVEILPPLVLYDEKGKYTEEVEKIFSGGTSV